MGDELSAAVTVKSPFTAFCAAETNDEPEEVDAESGDIDTVYASSVRRRTSTPQ